MKKRPKRRLEFWIAEDQHESLLKILDQTGAPIAAQIRIAVDEYLEKRGVAPLRPRKGQR